MQTLNKIGILLFACNLTTCGLFSQSNLAPKHPGTVLQKTLITSDDASGRVMRLPELQAWDAYIRRTTKNQVHGALLQREEKPVVLHGVRYWEFEYGENHPTHFLRWETFLVRLRDGRIFVEDVDSETLKPLSQWRSLDHPMGRIGK